MVKHLELSSIFNYTWEQVATAFWSRYPNPHSSHVLSEDTLFREMRGDSLYTRRLLTKTNRVPKWGERFVKNTVVSIIEESYVNPKEKTITTYTRNVGAYTRVMSIIEKVRYIPSPEDQTHTLAERSAWIDSQIYGFRRAIEGFGLDRFRKNCQQAAAGFNYIMNILYPAEEMLKLAGPTPVPISRFVETTGKLKEKAKRAGELAKEKTGSIPSVYAASCASTPAD